MSLLACSGAVDGPGPGVGLGGPLGQVGGVGQTNYAEGTLPSQSSVQELAGGCGNELSLRFAGETNETQNYLLRETVPSFFPKTTVVKVEGGTAQTCPQCQGRLLRVIDLGEAPGWTQGTLQQHNTKMFGWTIALSNDTWNPDLLPAARYRDYVIGVNGEVDLGSLEMKENHLYFFIISRTMGVPVTAPTAFASIEEFNAMFSCPKHGNVNGLAPFEPLRLIHTVEDKPVALSSEHIGKLPEPEESDADSDSDSSSPSFQLQKFPDHTGKLQ